jgi:EpsI family protein
MIRILAAMLFLALNGYVYHFFARTELHPVRESFDAFPMELDGWACDERQTIPPDVSDVLGASDVFLCAFRRNGNEQPGASVNVYVAFHETQIRKTGGGLSRSAIHLPKHCLPGSGWDVIDTGTAELDLPGLPQRPATVNRFVIAKGNQRQLTYYWYQSRGHVIAADYMKMVHLFWDRATKSRTDGSLVRLSVAMYREDVESAEADLREVASLVIPLLPRFIPE